MVTVENYRFFPVENIDDLHTGRYNYKKPKSTDASIKKSFFIIKICNLWRKHFKSIKLYVFQETMEANFRLKHRESVS